MVAALKYFTNKLQREAVLTEASSESPNFKHENLLSGSKSTYWETETVVAESKIDLECDAGKQVDFCVVDGLNLITAKTDERIDITLKGSNLPFIADPLAEAGDFTSFIEFDDPTKVTVDARRRIGSVSDKLELIADFTQATDANKPLLSRSDNRENLVQYSEELNNAIYTNVNAPVTPNAANNPVSGAATADLVVADTTNAAHELRQNIAVVSGKTYRISCYAKRNSGTTRFRLVGTTLFTNVNFTMEGDGSVTDTGAGASNVSVVALGDSWFRLSCTGVATGNGLTSLRLSLLNSSGTASFIGDDTGWFVYGAQLQEVEADPTYLPTTDHPQYAGINGKPVAVLNGAQALISTSVSSNIFTASAKLFYAVIVPFLMPGSGGQYLLRTSPGGNSCRFYLTNTGGGTFGFENHDGDWDAGNTTQVLLRDQPVILRGRHLSGNMHLSIDTGSGFGGEVSFSTGDTSSMSDTLQIGAPTSGLYGKILAIATANVGTPDAVFEAELRKKWLNTGTVIYQKTDIKQSDLIGLRKDQYLFTSENLSPSYQYFQFKINTDEEIKHRLRKLYFGEGFDLERGPTYPYSINLTGQDTDGFVADSGTVFKNRTGKPKRSYLFNYTAISDSMRNSYNELIKSYETLAPVYLHTTAEVDHNFIEQQIILLWLESFWESGEWKDLNNLAISGIEDSAI